MRTNTLSYERKLCATNKKGYLYGSVTEIELIEKLPFNANQTLNTF